jgi:hypothetical protein
MIYQCNETRRYATTSKAGTHVPCPQDLVQLAFRPLHLTNDHALWISTHAMTISNCTQINSNPDIAGIGIRFSTYALAFLNLVPATLFGSEGRISPHEEKTLDKAYTNLLFTSCALLLCAFIQAAKLSLYHALIILNLSWTNNAGAIAWTFNYFASEVLQRAMELWRILGSIGAFPIRSVRRYSLAFNFVGWRVSASGFGPNQIRFGIIRNAHHTHWRASLASSFR